MVVVPNSNIAKAVVTNRSRLNQHHVVALTLTFPQTVSTGQNRRDCSSPSAAEIPAVLKIPPPTIAMQNVNDLGVLYELDFYVARLCHGPDREK